MWFVIGQRLWQTDRESEDRSKATAGSFKKLQEVELPIGKVGAEQPSTGAWAAIPRLRRFLLLARNPCPWFSGSRRVQCLPLGHLLVGSSFLHFYKVQSKVSCNGFEVMVMMAWNFFTWSLASFFLERSRHGLVILKTTVPSVLTASCRRCLCTLEKLNNYRSIYIILCGYVRGYH